MEVVWKQERSQKKSRIRHANFFRPSRNRSEIMEMTISTTSLSLDVIGRSKPYSFKPKTSYSKKKSVLSTKQPDHVLGG